MMKGYNTKWTAYHLKRAKKKKTKTKQKQKKKTAWLVNSVFLLLLLLF